jgi:hypothetical protein
MLSHFLILLKKQEVLISNPPTVSNNLLTYVTQCHPRPIIMLPTVNDKTDEAISLHTLNGLS